MECCVVPSLKEAAVLAISNNVWRPVRTLLEGIVDKDSTEYTQLQQIRVNCNLIIINGCWRLVRIKDTVDKDSVDNTQLQQIHMDCNLIEEACSRGYTELVSVFLKSGFEVDCIVDMSSGLRMLHLAAYSGNLSLVKLLINSGANIDCKTHNGNAPLFYAGQEHNLEVFKYLISIGADINTCCKDGETLLLEALWNDTITEEMLQLLLDSGCDPMKCPPGSLAYWAIVKRNNVNTVRMLLDAGAHVNGMDTHFTPLHVAAWDGNIPIMELLLDYGADINARNTVGYTALHEAVRGEELQSVEFLIKHGSLIDSVNYYNETPLLLSIEYEYFNIAMLLINSGADLNLGIYDTVLHRAIKNTAHVELIECLLEHGASVTTVSLQHVIHHIDYSNDEKLHIAKFLLIYGSDHYVEDEYGNTLLHWACTVGDVELVEYLIYYGLNVDAKNREGKKPYNIATEKGYTNIVKAIIHYHCNKYTRFH